MPWTIYIEERYHNVTVLKSDRGQDKNLTHVALNFLFICKLGIFKLCHRIDLKCARQMVLNTLNFMPVDTKLRNFN